MAAHQPTLSNLRTDGTLAELLAEYTYQLLRRVAPDLKITPPPAADELIEDTSATLDTAPAWIRSAYASAKAQAHTDSGLTARDARAFAARDRLLAALARRNMTQADLARRLEKSPAAISRIFKAPHRSRLTTLQRIADALDVQLADLLSRSSV